MTLRGTLTARDGVLRLGRAAFTPDGLVARGETFRWDDVGGQPEFALPDRWPGTPAAGWAFHAWLRDMLAVGVYDGSALGFGEPVREVRIAWTLGDIKVALALASYLRDEPAARPGLGDPARVAALVRALHPARQWWSLGPREPLMGDAHDLHQAVVRGFRAVVPRRYDDRRVDDDPLPPPAEAVRAARLELPERLRDRFSDDEIAARAEPFLAKRPWPFGVLR